MWSTRKTRRWLDDICPVEARMNIIACFLAIVCPPVAIAFHEIMQGKKASVRRVITSLALTFLLYIPGLIHALYCILRDDQCYED